jgi:hypothetical protein
MGYFKKIHCESKYEAVFYGKLSNGHFKPFHQDLFMTQRLSFHQDFILRQHGIRWFER